MAIDEVLEIADQIQNRIHENVEIILKKAQEKGNTGMIYSDAYNTALLMEIASMAYALKKLKS